MALPTELSITQLAMALGLTRRVVERRVDSGIYPSMRTGTAPNSKRVITLESLRIHCPLAYEAILRNDAERDDFDDE